MGKKTKPTEKTQKVAQHVKDDFFFFFFLELAITGIEPMVPY